MDLTNAFEALGVKDEDEEPRANARLPRTAAKTTTAKTQDEIVAASKDPALYEYVRKREFGEQGTTEPAPGDAAGRGQLLRDPQAPSDPAALRRSARA